MRKIFLLRRVAKQGSLAFFAAAMAAMKSGCATRQDWRDENKDNQHSALQVAPGYTVSVLASNMSSARHRVIR